MWKCTNCCKMIEDELDTCFACGTTREGEPDPTFQPVGNPASDTRRGSSEAGSVNGAPIIVSGGKVYFSGGEVHLPSELEPQAEGLDMAPSQSGLLGRSAALVHLLALIAAGMAWAVVTFALMRTEEQAVVAGMGITATSVLCVWAALQAVRAVYQGGSSRWAWAVICGTALESFLLGVWLWYLAIDWYEIGPWETWLIRMGAPVAALYAALVLIVAAVVARRRAKAVRTKAEEQGRVVERWRAAAGRLLWFPLLAAVLGTALLPPSLCVLSATRTGGHSPGFQGWWCHKAARAMPAFVTDAAELFVPTFEGGECCLRARLLEYGNPSVEWLIIRLADADVGNAAWRGLQRRFPMEALRCAHEIAAGKLCVSENAMYSSANWLGARGDLAELRTLLSTSKLDGLRVVYRNGSIGIGLEPHFKTFMQGLIWQIAERPDDISELVPLLEKIAEEQAPGGQFAVRALLMRCPAAEFDRLCSKFALHKNSDYAVRAAWSIHSQEAISVTLALLFLGRQEEYIRESILKDLVFEVTTLKASDGPTHRRWCARLMELLDDAEPKIQFGAAWLLAKELGVSTQNVPDLPGHSSQFLLGYIHPTFGCLQGGPRRGLNPAEAALVAQAKAAAQAWLAKTNKDGQ